MAEDLELEQKHWRLDKSKLPADGSFTPDVHDYYVLRRRRDNARPSEVILEESGPMDYPSLLKACVVKFKKLEKNFDQVVKDDHRAFEYGKELLKSMGLGEEDTFSLLKDGGDKDKGFEIKAQMGDVTPEPARRPLSAINHPEFNALIDSLTLAQDSDLAYRAFYALEEDARNCFGRQVALEMEELKTEGYLASPDNYGELEKTKFWDFFEEIINLKIPLTGASCFAEARIS